jgi:hypothetical protein
MGGVGGTAFVMAEACRAGGARDHPVTPGSDPGSGVQGVRPRRRAALLWSGHAIGPCDRAKRSGQAIGPSLEPTSPRGSTSSTSRAPSARSRRRRPDCSGVPFDSRLFAGHGIGVRSPPPGAPAPPACRRRRRPVLRAAERRPAGQRPCQVDVGVPGPQCTQFDSPNNGPVQLRDRRETAGRCASGCRFTPSDDAGPAGRRSVRNPATARRDRVGDPLYWRATQTIPTGRYGRCRAAVR